MQTTRTIALFSAASLACIVASMHGCEKKAEPTTPAAIASGVAKPDDHAHTEGDGHDHGPTTQLGEQTAGGFTITASRDGEVIAGADAAIDVWVTGGADKVAAVRFWIGTQDGKGSVKAKAELERDNWHTHAEIPNPIPAGSKLWVEVEVAGGQKHLVAFDLVS